MTDEASPGGAAPVARGGAKLAALRENFTVTVDERIRGRRVTVHERRSAVEEATP